MKNKLPISVLVPLAPDRATFFDRFVMPLIKANNPAQIIVNDSTGSAAYKRNRAFEASTQPLIFCCDDDTLLPAGMFEALSAVLNKQKPGIGFAYTGYTGIKLFTPDKKDRNPLVFKVDTQAYSDHLMQRAANGISTMSLMRADAFQSVGGFDESLPHLEDLDLYLHLLSKGIRGVAVPGWEFMAFYLNRGSTFSGGHAEALPRIRSKWGLKAPGI